MSEIKCPLSSNYNLLRSTVSALSHSTLHSSLTTTPGTCDALMDAMKGQCASLSGVYERSDAMLAVYPGEGARFAKHIDNSTGELERCSVNAKNTGWIVVLY